MASVMLLAALLFTAGPPSASARPTAAPAGLPRVGAPSAILIDALTGRVLFERDADSRRPPASTTKIITAILLLENTKPDDQITADKTVSDTEGASLDLAAGEHISAQDMLYALMLRSANDGCVATAKHISGSEPAFVALMNRKAAEIGVANTHFSNTNGLPDPLHYSTARDLALMARYATRFPAFNVATKAKFHKLTRSTPNKDTVIKNKVRLLWTYPGADGIKTGFTTPAGKCLVGSATKDGWRLISVVLKSPDTAADSAALFNYGFTNFELVRIADAGRTARGEVRGGAERWVRAVTREPLAAVVPKGQAASFTLRTRLSVLRAPVRAEARIGELEAVCGTTVLASTPLFALTSVPLAQGPTGLAWAVTRWLLLAAVIGGLWYGSAASKAARIRRYRLKARMRISGPGGPGNG